MASSLSARPSPLVALGKSATAKSLADSRGYGAALALMVLTKENAMFAYIAILCLLATNHWLHFGRITPVSASSACSVLCSGSSCSWVSAAGSGPRSRLPLLVSKASVLEYAIRTGDGPGTILVDLMVVSPVILILALGGTFRLRAADRAGLYLLLFVPASFSVMAKFATE